MNKKSKVFKPCPKCGGNITLYSSGETMSVYAECNACGAKYSIPVKIKTWKSNPIRISETTIRKAIDKWNNMHL